MPVASMPARFPSLSTRPPLSRPRMSSTARDSMSAVVRRLLSHSRFSGSSSKIASRMGTVALNTPGDRASERNSAVAPERGGATTNMGLSITAAVWHLTAPPRDDPIAPGPRSSVMGRGEGHQLSAPLPFAAMVACVIAGFLALDHFANANEQLLLGAATWMILI